MGDILTTALGNVLGEVITVVLGLVLTGVSTWGAFYIKRMNDKFKLKTLVDEVNRYVQWAEQAKSFKLLSSEEKKQTVLERIQQFAIENGISVTESELAIMVERSVQSIMNLEMAGLKLMKLKKEKTK